MKRRKIEEKYINAEHIYNERDGNDQTCPLCNEKMTFSSLLDHIELCFARRRTVMSTMVTSEFLNSTPSSSSASSSEDDEVHDGRKSSALSDSDDGESTPRTVTRKGMAGASENSTSPASTPNATPKNRTYLARKDTARYRRLHNPLLVAKGKAASLHQ